MVDAAAPPGINHLALSAVHGLSGTDGIVAVAAGAIALLALLAAALLARQLRGLRADQRAVLGPGRRDLVAHAAELQRGFEDLSAYVEDVAGRLEARLSAAEARLDGAIAYRGIVRYDAYNEMSGRQSTSIALLDANGSGIVFSSIHHRDQARLYSKQVTAGRGELELSPEEAEAVRVAMAGEVHDAAYGGPAPGAGGIR
jgi:Protein of unknown function (DUF4446)